MIQNMKLRLYCLGMRHPHWQLAVWSLGILTVVAFMLWWPNTYHWQGDGKVSLRTLGGQQASLRAAMLATRRQHGPGLYRHYQYEVQQVDLSDSTYVRFSDCHLVGTQTTKCQATNGNYYQIRVLVAPDLHQSQDDDGVDTSQS